MKPSDSRMKRDRQSWKLNYYSLSSSDDSGIIDFVTAAKEEH